MKGRIHLERVGDDYEDMCHASLTITEEYDYSKSHILSLSGGSLHSGDCFDLKIGFDLILDS